MTTKPLAGQVALVTGASRGIGKATALALAESGASIAVAFGHGASEAATVVADCEALGVKAVALRADLSDLSAAASLVAQTITELGQLNIVVNNAGITRDGLALRLSDDDWQDVITVNLSAAFAICRAALKPMLRQRSGRIINVSSIAGVIGNPGQSNYSAAKAGLIGMTKSLAREVGSRSITVTAVAPGFIATEMTQQLGAAIMEQAVANVPMGRMGSAAEVAAAIRFLALPDASYITGCVLHVDGGLAA